MQYSGNNFNVNVNLRVARKVNQRDNSLDFREIYVPSSAILLR